MFAILDVLRIWLGPFPSWICTFEVMVKNQTFISIVLAITSVTILKFTFLCVLRRIPEIDDDRIANTASASFAKSKVASYSSFTRQTTVWWREETTFSGTTLRKFINHRIGIRGHYKLMDDPLLSDQIDGRLIWNLLAATPLRHSG